MINISTSDFDRAARVLERFPEKVAEKVLLAAGGAAAKLVRDEAARLAPRSGFTGSRGWKKGARYRHVSGLLARSVRVKIVSRSRHEVVFSVRPTGKRVYYWWFVEAGTKPHAQPKAKRQHPGARARPYLSPAADAKGPDAARLMRAALVNAVNGLAAEMSKA